MTDATTPNTVADVAAGVEQAVAAAAPAALAVAAAVSPADPKLQLVLTALQAAPGMIQALQNFQNIGLLTPEQVNANIAYMQGNLRTAHDQLLAALGATVA